MDGAWLPDVVNRYERSEQCFGVITDDGTVIVRDFWNAEAQKWEDTPDFDARARLVMERLERDHYLTVIDAHN